MAAPNDFQAEQAVLGSIALEPRLADAARGHLPGPQAFFDPRHRALYEALLAVIGRGEGVDRVTVGFQVEVAGGLREFRGGRARFEEVFHEVCRRAVGVRHFEAHLNIIRKLWVQRELQRSMFEHADAAGVPQADVEQLLHDLRHNLTGFAGLAAHHPTLALGDVADDVVTDTLDRVEEARRLGAAGMLGLPTGIPGLSELISGLKPATFVLLAADPGEGKSTMMMQMANAVADGAAGRCGADRGGAHIVTLEMTARELVGKTLYGEAGVDSQRADAGELEDWQLHEVERTAARLKGRRVFIDELTAAPFAAVRARAIRAREEHGIEIVFIDHLLEIPCPPRVKMRHHASQIAADAKALARELDIPVVGLVHLSRGGGKGKRRSTRPTQQSIAESSFFERRADQILLLWPRGPINPERLTVSERLDAQVREKLTIIVDKNRGGRGGDVDVVFNKTLGRLMPPPTLTDQFFRAEQAPEPRQEPQI